MDHKKKVPFDGIVYLCSHDAFCHYAGALTTEHISIEIKGHHPNSDIFIHHFASLSMYFRLIFCFDDEI